MIRKSEEEEHGTRTEEEKEVKERGREIKP